MQCNAFKMTILRDSFSDWNRHNLSRRTNILSPDLRIGDQDQESVKRGAIHWEFLFAIVGNFYYRLEHKGRLVSHAFIQIEKLNENHARFYCSLSAGVIWDMCGGNNTIDTHQCVVYSLLMLSCSCSAHWMQVICKIINFVSHRISHTRALRSFMLAA